ncbi:ribonuclease E [Micrococcales bacterium KH10]|nr:ribonuclease E [Micrococcales bacterium KH10]
MILDETPESTPATPAAKKPRRRVTRPAGKPSTSEQPVSNESVDSADKPALDVFAELGALAEKPEPKKRATSRSRKPKQENAQADASDAAATAQPEATEARTDEAGTVAAKKSTGTRRKQATKSKKNASSESSEQKTEVDDVADLTAALDEALDGAERRKTSDDQAPTKRAKQQRRRPAAAPIFSAPEPDADLADDAVEDEVTEPAPEIRLASTTLLFQAPEVAPRARKRRAAQAAEDADAAETDLPDVVESDQDDTADVAPKTRRRRIERDISGEGEASDEDQSDEGADQDEDSDDDSPQPRRRRRRGGRGRRKSGTEDSATDADEDNDTADETTPAAAADDDESSDETESSSRRRRRRRRSGQSSDQDGSDRNTRARGSSDQVVALKGSTRLEAKRQRRREGRDAGRRRQVISEAEFLARRESVDRTMIVRERSGRTQIAVLEDGVLVEHYVSQQSQASMAGNVYLGRVQNVLPSMEAAFVDIGKGRNAVLYAGEVNWDAAGLADGQPRRIEQALKPGDTVMVQVTKDPIGHKGARLTSQVTLAGRYLVFVPGGGMTGISRKLPDTERSRLKKLLRELVPDGAGVIVRTAAEGASEDELRSDIARLESQWQAIEKKAKTASAPSLLQGEPDMAIRVVRDIFNDDFKELVVSGKSVYQEISSYVHELAPDLESKLTKWASNKDVFSQHRIDEQLAKGMDRKVWLPSGGSLVIDRTEAMTVIDVNTGKFTGSGGTLEETVTRNNLEAAEEIVRQLRLRDIGGIVVVDFIDMVLESNRDLVLRRLVECLGRDRTKHQVAEVTSLGLVQMTRKRVGQGLVEAFSETCSHCLGRGFIVHSDPIERGGSQSSGDEESGKKSRRRKNNSNSANNAKEPASSPSAPVPVLPEASSKEREVVKATLARIADAAAHAHEHEHDEAPAETTESATK